MFAIWYTKKSKPLHSQKERKKTACKYYGLEWAIIIQSVHFERWDGDDS